MKHLFVIVTVFIFCSCSPEGDLLPVFNEFEEELPEEALDKCVAENPKLSREDCNIKKCLASPLTLIAMQDLLLTTAKVLDEVGLTWWLEGGSAIAQERFEAHLPWDDDVDLQVLSSEFSEEKIAEVRRKLHELGFDFRPFIATESAAKSEKHFGLDQVQYRESRFYNLILSQNPSLSPADLRNLWKRYNGQSHPLPHLDIFRMVETKPDHFNYAAEAFAGGVKGDYPKSTLMPVRQSNVLGKNFPAPAYIVSYGKISFGTDDIRNDFYIARQHSAGCAPVTFKNINSHPETLRFLFNYLDFVYKTPAAKALGVTYDKKIIANAKYPSLFP